MPRYLCHDCHFLGQPVRNLRGSPAVELILWLLFVIPGAVYAWWRIKGMTPLCNRCGSPRVVPEFSVEANLVIAAHAELPTQGLGPRVWLWRAFWITPFASGVAIVLLFLLSTLFQSLRDRSWFYWIVVVAAAPIVGHSLWSAVHIVLWFKAKLWPQ
jgi:hypothetical protein